MSSVSFDINFVVKVVRHIFKLDGRLGLGGLVWFRLKHYLNIDISRFRPF